VLTGVAALGLGASVGACRDVEEGQGSVAQRGRLAFRPGTPAGAAGTAGRIEVQGADGARPAAVYVPPSDDQAPMRLVVVLHGAGGKAARAVNLLRAFADANRLLLVAPQSLNGTWDVLAGRYGPDVRNIDTLLERVSSSYPVDRYAVSGFSDGASYALSLGLTNGDIFDAVIAFSPGFSAVELAHGRPRIFVSHGTQDEVLPIERCSRRIVPALRSDGYDVTYVEFPGGHVVPDSIRRRAVDWLTSASASK
jgi:predicted esterase